MTRQGDGVALKSMRVRQFLFITWDGPKTQYLEALFLPIFGALRALGYAPHVLQFTWGAPEVLQKRAALAAAAGIPYRAIPLGAKGGGLRAVGALFDGARQIRRAVTDWQIDTLLPRSLLPAFAVLRLRPALRERLHILFDADGLMADERVEFAGLAACGLRYRLLRDLEAEMLRQADAVLCRTAAARMILLARAGSGLQPEACHLVSNCVDPAPFVAALAQRQAVSGFTLCYSGSLGPQYRLPDMLRFATALKREVPDLRFRFLTPDAAPLRAALAAAGVETADWISHDTLPHAAIPAALVGCDLGLSLRLASFSTQAVQPIKLWEYLMAGVPVLGSDPAAALQEIETEGVFKTLDLADLAASLRWVVEEIRPNRDVWRRKCHDLAALYLGHVATAREYDRAFTAMALPQIAPHDADGDRA